MEFDIVNNVQQQEQQASCVSKRNGRKNVKCGVEDENLDDHVDPETPSGDKKFMSCKMAKQCNPSAVEKSREW